jgi:hypothetical protein
VAATAGSMGSGGSVTSGVRIRDEDRWNVTVPPVFLGRRDMRSSLVPYMATSDERHGSTLRKVRPGA